MSFERHGRLMRLRTVQERPYNAEAPLPILTQIPTPTQLFYVRSSFDIPDIDIATWRLRVTGAVAREREFTFDEIAIQFDSVEALVLLECAGNGRRRMVPVPSGVAWDLGAVSCAVFRGIALADLLAACGVAANAVELLFVGADRGELSAGRVVAFERSLPIAKARDRGVLLANQMNGQPLRREHGYPLRVVVPGWYAVSSVKWLTELRVLTEPFRGHFQTEKYIYVDDPIAQQHEPVRETRVRAIIAQPSDGDSVNAGMVRVQGIAWSGVASIAMVEVSCDDGESWHEAELTVPNDANAPTVWSHGWQAAPGEYAILARATDAAGNMQPTAPIYNRLGYGNNVVHAIKVNVR
ncbi:MAG: sulfite oxidase [Gemmatimonadota bacterium]